MSTFDEKVARAKEAQAANPPHRDVTVSLDTRMVDERNRLLAENAELYSQREALVEAAKGTLALAPDTTTIDKRIAAVVKKLDKLTELEKDTLATIRVYRIRGDDWMDLKAVHPARLESAIDRGAGYNVTTLTKAAIESHGRIVDGDDESELTPEQWAEMWPLLAGSEFERVADAVYGVNDAEAKARVERLKNS